MLDKIGASLKTVQISTRVSKFMRFITNNAIHPVIEMFQSGVKWLTLWDFYTMVLLDPAKKQKVDFFT